MLPAWFQKVLMAMTKLKLLSLETSHTHTSFFSIWTKNLIIFVQTLEKSSFNSPRKLYFRHGWEYQSVSRYFKGIFKGLKNPLPTWYLSSRKSDMSRENLDKSRERYLPIDFISTTICQVLWCVAMVIILSVMLITSDRYGELRCVKCIGTIITTEWN